jgi:hypothetical protein
MTRDRPDQGLEYDRPGYTVGKINHLVGSRVVDFYDFVLDMGSVRRFITDDTVQVFCASFLRRTCDVFGRIARSLM